MQQGHHGHACINNRLVELSNQPKSNDSNTAIMALNFTADEPYPASMNMQHYT